MAEDNERFSYKKTEVRLVVTSQFITTFDTRPHKGAHLIQVSVYQNVKGIGGCAKSFFFLNNCRVSGCKTHANQLCIDRDVCTAILPVFVKRRGRKFMCPYL